MSDESEFIPRDQATGGGTQAPARPDEVLPDTLQLVPLGARPYFPVLVQPIVVDKEPWGEGLKVVSQSAHKLLALAYAPHPGEGIPEPDAVRGVGTVVRVHRFQEVQDKLQFIAQGIRRFRIREWVRRMPPYIVRVEYFEDEHRVEDENQVRAYAGSIINIINQNIPKVIDKLS